MRIQVLYCSFTQNKIFELQYLNNLNFHSNMGLLKRLKQLIEMTDFFNSTQMLRYENQNEYRTFTGGVLSLGIITTIIIAFASMILDTINLTSITYTQKIVTFTDPTLTKITASPDSNFMYGIEIWNHNLSSSLRYFDIVAQIIYHESNISQTENVKLVQCTKEHWAFLPSFMKEFDKFQASGWLCPQIGSSFDAVGIYTSDNYGELFVTVAPCSNETDPTRSCASPQEIDQLFADNGDLFYFTFYYVNTIINPDQPDYKSYYLQGSAYGIFGKQLGIQSFLSISDFNIQTDYSIWPFINQKEDSGFLTLESPTNHPYSITPNNKANYINFGVEKSTQSVYYTREVQKISTIFSFIGGLIGAIMAGLFLINAYTSFAYQISIAIEVFKKQQDLLSQNQEPQRHGKNYCFVNFVQFLKYHAYHLVKHVKGSHVNSDTEHLSQCRKQILKQLDIKSLIKRIIFLEYSMTFLLTEDQLQGLQLHKPTNPNEVKAIRKKIENVDLAELQSNTSLHSEAKPNEEMSDSVEPPTQSAFKFRGFRSSPQVANNFLSGPQIDIKSPGLELAKKMSSINENNNLIIQDVSCSSDQQILKRKKRMMMLREKKTTRISNLITSAQGGNELSKRILESIRLNKQQLPQKL